MKGLLPFLFLLFSPAAVTAQITAVEPARGFPWGGSVVTIRGSALWADFVNCADPCVSCPVAVEFGGIPAQVRTVAPTYVVVNAPAHGAGSVDVTLRRSGRSALVLRNAFTYDSGAIATPQDYARYLIPITLDQVRGGRGSLWVSELTVMNGSEHHVTLVAPWCASLACLPPSYPPNFDAREEVSARADGGDGAFVYVPHGVRAEVGMQLRVRDVSRVAEGWGTDIPVVPHDDFAQIVEIVDVPTDSRYRAHLRIYGESNAHAARISVFPPDSDTPTEVRTVALQPAVRVGEFVRHPAYILVDAFSDASRALPYVRIRVEGLPQSPRDDTFAWSTWAMVSLTNNETQQVTLVTPHRNGR